MITVPVEARSSSYEVIIGAGLLDDISDRIRQITAAKRCVVVSGENVFPLYGERVLSNLRDGGFDSYAIVFPSGEDTKCMQRYEELLNFLTSKKMTRSDCLIALGGGVTGDLTGFAAATYQRGIPYIQIPTTLLAAVDSSVGGKTAINLSAAKNQVGAFYQPKLVLCDTDCLKTLPPREMHAGFAEVIKYAILGDADLFDMLSEDNHTFESIIEICVRMKADIVADDENDLGRRKLLNFGHTFGHAVESRSQYRLLHGEAVSIGMSMMSGAAVKMGYLDEESKNAVLNMLYRYQLPTETEFTADELYDTLLLDKKFSAGTITLIVPRAVGWCEMHPVTPKDLREWLDAAYE